MNIQLDYKPAHTLAVVDLDPGELIRAESGAMVSMKGDMAVQTGGQPGEKKGIFRRLKRTVLSGETFFTNTFQCQSGAAQVTLAPKLCGDMVVHDLTGDHELMIQGSSYVAAPDPVSLDTKWQGFRKLFSGESLWFLRAFGQGPVVINAFGAIAHKDLNNESLILDTGHLVAFTSGLDYKVRKASKGWISSFLSGEGLVLEIRGTGRVYMQSRNPGDYGTFIGAQLPPR
ncbi:MAG: TIGR00266 family protein [Myxococcales bacterium]|nr:TIGR00266 family protein [Myxococcales bacterium]